ncbi:MAG: nucleotidyltransferase family protein [Flavonifractor plautii]
MATAGIVAEYNPFHRGHAWHIARTRRTLGADTAVVCVMSGHWVQRGECALTDKWSRAALALSGGADLVLELPTPWAMASAEAFARGGGPAGRHGGGGRALLGSETGTGAPAGGGGGSGWSGLPGAAAGRADPWAVLPGGPAGGGGGRLPGQPNDNLGWRHLRALPPGMEALTIPRRGAAHDGPAAGGFASASELRALLRAGRAAEADPYLPAPWSGETASMAHIDRAVLARLRTMDEADWAALPDGGAAEGLPARLARSARTADSLEDFYARAKTKRYPHARLRRLALAAFLGLRAAERPPVAPYVRVLGLSSRGRALLRRMKETCALPVVVKPAQARALDGDARALFEAEARRTDLFGLCFPTARPCGLEWTRSPVVKERQG